MTGTFQRNPSRKFIGPPRSPPNPYARPFTCHDVSGPSRENAIAPGAATSAINTALSFIHFDMFVCIEGVFIEPCSVGQTNRRPLPFGNSTRSPWRDCSRLQQRSDEIVASVL